MKAQQMISSKFNKPIALTGNSAEIEIGKVIDGVRQGVYSKDILIDLLSERHPVYNERPTHQTIRIKGYAMASFAEAGLPGAALNFVLDELQNGRNAYMVAAAARSLRGAKKPQPQFCSFLLQALENIRYHDDSMSLDIFKPSWPLTHPTTAKKEIFLTFQWLQGYAKGFLPELNALLKNTSGFDAETRTAIQKAITSIEADNRVLDISCCEIEGKSSTALSRLWKSAGNIRNIGKVEVENQHGITQPLEAIINQKPTVVVFFYTRCMNPNKCTLTINKLGWLQQMLLKHQLQEKVNLLAFTYDPAFDTAGRMQVFGENRGVVFTPNMHMLRTQPEDFPLLSAFFELGVNHVASTVNQHRLELFLLDRKGNLRTSYTRLQWETEKVFENIQRLLAPTSPISRLSPVISCFRQVVFPILIAIFPKCPVCWAAYLSAFGISGLQSIPYSPWLIPWIMGAIAVNLIILYRKARVRNGLIPFWISLAGGILIIGPGYLLFNKTASVSGVLLIVAGAILNSLSWRQWAGLHHFFSSRLTTLKKYDL